MSDCPSAEMRDALPELMFSEMDAGRRAEVQSHVDACPECTAELALLERVYASARVPLVDVNRVVSALPAPGRRVSVFGSPALRMAAALALLIGGSTWFASGRENVTPANTPVMVATAPVAPAGPSEVVRPAKATKHPATTAIAAAPAGKGISLDGGLGDFSDAELRSLLASIDSFESNVRVEPADVLDPVIESEEMR